MLFVEINQKEKPHAKQNIEVSKLRLLKANHQTQQYRMQDNLLRHFPEQIERTRGYIAGFDADTATVAANTPAKGDFFGMEVLGKRYIEKEAAGNALLDACKTFHGDAQNPVSIWKLSWFYDVAVC